MIQATTISYVCIQTFRYWDRKPFFFPAKGDDDDASRKATQIKYQDSFCDGSSEDRLSVSLEGEGGSKKAKKQQAEGIRTVVDVVAETGT